jgi:CheY-like chemotaxis protein
VADEGPKRSDPHRDVTGALHDVSNALTVMLGWLAEARAPGAAPESIADALRIIEQRARAARDLARRAIGAATAVVEEDQPIGGVVEEAIAALAVEAQRAGVQIAVRGLDSPEKARVAAATDVSQIVTNLVLNALAHAPHGSRLEVSISAFETSIAVDVVDAGPGVAPARRNSIFEGDSAREGGAGVGLRHAREMARAAGGELELLAASTGAHFRLSWPRADALPPAPRSVPRMRLFEGAHVLVVEDDAHVTQLLEAALVARGAEVTVARSASELHSALASGTPHDAVLIDLSPIAADPEGAIAALRARAPDATMVVISGSAVELPAPLQGASVRFVRKPFEVGEIVSALAAGRLPKT